MSKTFKDIFWIVSFILFSTILIWLPHFLALPNFWNLDFTAGFNTIYRNYDGLNYVVIAKTFYDPTLIARIPQALPANYFAAHFPGFPILIALFAPIFGYLKSMLFVSVLFTIFSAIAFYFLVRNFKLTSNPFLLTLVFTLLPARWLIVRSVGSPEPVFIFFIIMSMYFFLHTTHIQLRSHYIWISAIFASLAQLVRPPAVLLFLAVALYVHFDFHRKIKSAGFKQALIDHLKYYPFLLMPLTLFGIFAWYSLTYNDFFAYFNSGDNIHLAFPPFQIFNASQFWVGTPWLEDVVYIFILFLLGGLLLFKQKLYAFSFFVLTYLTASFFVSHRDISRYILPIAPFVIIAFEKVLVSKEFKWVLIILAIALYLYSQNFILNNAAPVPDLSYYN